MSSLLLSKPVSRLVLRNYAAPDTFQFPVTDLTTPTRKRFNRFNPYSREGAKTSALLLRASSSLPRIFEERGHERWNGNHSPGPRQRFDEWDGWWFEQTTCYTPAAYLWEQRKLPRGSLLDGDECLASFECSREIRFGSWFQSVIISYSMCLRTFFKGKRRNGKVSMIVLEYHWYYWCLKYFSWFGKFVSRFWSRWYNCLVLLNYLIKWNNT